MNPTTYQPKGSMCMACERRDQNCSALFFQGMPVLQRPAANLVIVRCTNFAAMKGEGHASR